MGVPLSRFTNREDETLERDQRKLLRLMRKYGFEVFPVSEVTSVSVGPDARFVPGPGHRHGVSNEHDDSSTPTYAPTASLRSHITSASNGGAGGSSSISNGNNSSIAMGPPKVSAVEPVASAELVKRAEEAGAGDAGAGAGGFINPLAETPVHRATLNTPADASPTAATLGTDVAFSYISQRSASAAGNSSAPNYNLETVSSSTSSTAVLLSASVDLGASTTASTSSPPLLNGSIAPAPAEPSAPVSPPLLQPIDSADRSTPSGVPPNSNQWASQSTNPHA